MHYVIVLQKKIKEFVKLHGEFTTPMLEKYLANHGYKHYYTRNQIAQKIRLYAEVRKEKYGFWKTRKDYFEKD